ncbi:VanZ family protein [Thalassotalea nanhaiensis]|uniref:VanZ family protein n=1 Tax=Thalassotalea nanhaiensis TaxID=3065648 RepID=A0ABY9TJB3_9GAMM|nr:VanZ family protein [Colwelliaceae bacterium SQ345]
MNILFATIRTYWIAIALFILAVITALSLYPLQSLPSVPGSDKTHHFIAYGALMFPVALRRPNNWMFIGLFFVFWGGGIELVQPYVNRYGEWLDMAANTGGIFFGLLAAQFINWFWPDSQNKSSKN